MISNRELVEIYFKSWNKNNVLQFLRQNLKLPDEVIDSSFDSWIKSFNFHWTKVRSQSRFLERKTDWLNSEFEIKTSKSPPFRLQVSIDKRNRPAQGNLNENALNTSKVRGRKPKKFGDLLVRTKKTYSCALAKKHSLEELLLAAETVAYQGGQHSTRKILKLLRNGSEKWAKSTLLCLSTQSSTTQPSVEKALMLKTRLSLSKSRYRGVSTFMRREMGQKWVSWKEMMDYRNGIIPEFSTNESKGYLASTVSVRNLITKDVERISELDDVKQKLASVASEGVVDCVMHVSAGPDSATGFSHYNQTKFLARDDSLLTEHFMSLKLETDKGVPLYINPNPQSDTFCRVRCMCWTKETDSITREMFEDFFDEIDQIAQNPIVFELSNVQLRIKAKGIYSMIDGKAANAIVGNRDTHACPLCVQGADERVGPSYFHSMLNAVEWVMRYSAKKSVPGHPALTDPRVKAAARSQADELEKHFQLNINRPKAGGSGSSNNGNMARRLLDQPEIFAKIVGIDAELVKNLRLISRLALSSRKLEPAKLQKLYDTLEKQIFLEFPFVKRLPPCIHKYKHLPEVVETLPFTLNFIDEQAGERCHKRHKFSRPHLSRKTSAVDNLTDMMRAALAWSDPKMSYMAYVTSSKRKSRKKCDKDFEAQMAEYEDTGEKGSDVNLDCPYSSSDDESSDSDEDTSEEDTSDANSEGEDTTASEDDENDV